jgi:hypothetical protein
VSFCIFSSSLPDEHISTNSSQENIEPKSKKKKKEMRKANINMAKENLFKWIAKPQPAHTNRVTRSSENNSNKERGAQDDFFTKPVTVEELQAKLNQKTAQKEQWVCCVSRLRITDYKAS